MFDVKCREDIVVEFGFSGEYQMIEFYVIVGVFGFVFGSFDKYKLNDYKLLDEMIVIVMLDLCIIVMK